MSKANGKKKGMIIVKPRVNKSTKQRVKKTVTKCEKCNKPFSYDPMDEKHALCKTCLEEKNKIVYRNTCKDCGKDFYVKASEAEFLKSKGLEMPKRCFECRNVHKIKKAKENG